MDGVLVAVLWALVAGTANAQGLLEPEATLARLGPGTVLLLVGDPILAKRLRAFDQRSDQVDWVVRGGTSRLLEDVLHTWRLSCGAEIGESPDHTIRVADTCVVNLNKAPASQMTSSMLMPPGTPIAPPGPVSIVRADGGRFVDTALRIETTGIQLAGAGVLTWDQVGAVRTREPRFREMGALRGGAIGFAAGAIPLAFAFAQEAASCETWCLITPLDSALLGVGVGGSLGGLVGLAVGAIAPGKRWRDLPPPTPSGG